MKGQELNVIRGLPPALTAIPKGCAFNPRCAYVQDVCRDDPPPPPYDVEFGRTSRCHFWREVMGSDRPQ
jgi:oligopeptide transport system ATP-binding protein